MSNWLTKKRRGFWWWFGVFFLIIGGGAVARFFFDGRSLPDDWPSMFPQLAISFVGALVAGFALSNLEKNHNARGDRNAGADQ